MRTNRIMLTLVLAASVGGAATIAYRDPRGRIVLRTAGAPKTISTRNRRELCVLPDGKALLYTRDQPDGPNRTLRSVGLGSLPESSLTTTNRSITFRLAFAWRCDRSKVRSGLSSAGL